MAFADFAFENINAERIENFSLDGAPQRAGAVNRIVSFAREQFLGRIGEFQCDLLLLKALRKAAELDFDDFLQIVFRETIENNDLINAVKELWTEMRAQCVHDQSPPSFARFFLGDVLRPDV